MVVTISLVRRNGKFPSVYYRNISL